MEAALRCKDLSCGYGSKSVLSGINVEVAEGQIVALLGPNGCGKSTLLKTVIGEIAPLAGDVLIGGCSTKKLTAKERAQRVAFVPSEELSEFPFLVREIVAMGRIPHSDGLFDSEEDRRITQQAMERAQCEHLADRPITNISAGERQRALIARALAQKAQVLLLDEPTSHLDPGHQVSFVSLVRQLAKEGLAVLIAMHDLTLSAHVADYAVLIADGNIACAGTIEEVLSSETLDKAYNTGFERIKGSDGSIRLSPMFR